MLVNFCFPFFWHDPFCANARLFIDRPCLGETSIYVSFFFFFFAFIEFPDSWVTKSRSAGFELSPLRCISLRFSQSPVSLTVSFTGSFPTVTAGGGSNLYVYITRRFVSSRPRILYRHSSSTRHRRPAAVRSCFSRHDFLFCFFWCCFFSFWVFGSSSSQGLLLLLKDVTCNPRNPSRQKKLPG